MEKPILKNSRIKLIPLCAEHMDIYTELANIPEINKRVHKPPHYTNANFNELLEKIKAQPNFFIWMIETDNGIRGVINTAEIRRQKIFQGGYWVNPDNWGKGLASSSLLLVNEFLFRDCAAERIQAVVEPDNIASIHVLEKCGYEQEGLLRKFYSSNYSGLKDVFMYSCIR